MREHETQQITPIHLRQLSTFHQTHAKRCTRTPTEDTTLTCTREDAHFSRAHIKVRNSKLFQCCDIGIGSRQKTSVSRISPKPFSSRCHVFVECPYRPLPSCLFIAYWFYLTTLSVIDLVGKEQIKLLCLCSLELIHTHAQTLLLNLQPLPA